MRERVQLVSDQPDDELPELLPYPRFGLIHVATADGAYWWEGEGALPNQYQIVVAGPMKWSPWAYKAALIEVLSLRRNSDLEWVSIELLTPDGVDPCPNIVFDRGFFSLVLKKFAAAKPEKK
jgi:hypothetical protein